MTITRSAMSATTPRSWVTKITPLFICWLSCFTSSRIWAWTVTSSAVVGSSAIRNLDVPPILVGAMLTGFFVVLFGAIVDVLYAMLDPRVRLTG